MLSHHNKNSTDQCDNESETKNNSMPVNLRHQLNNNDLHNTCRKQQEELSEQKIKNETMSTLR